MGQYHYSRPKRLERKWAVHPIWRGIGLVWMVLLPIMSFAGAWEFVRANFEKNWLPLTKTLASPINLPMVKINDFYINFQNLISWIPGSPLYYADLLFFFAFLFLGFGFTSVVYAFLYRFFGPPRDPYESIEVTRHRRYRGG